MSKYIEDCKVRELLLIESENWILTVNRYSDAKDSSYISNGKGKVYNVRMPIANKLVKKGLALVLHNKRYA